MRFFALWQFFSFKGHPGAHFFWFTSLQKWILTYRHLGRLSKHPFLAVFWPFFSPNRPKSTKIDQNRRKSSKFRIPTIRENRPKSSKFRIPTIKTTCWRPGQVKTRGIEGWRVMKHAVGAARSQSPIWPFFRQKTPKSDLKSGAPRDFKKFHRPRYCPKSVFFQLESLSGTQWHTNKSHNSYGQVLIRF